MIAVVILGILAVLAMPFFTKTAEKARGNEAKIALNLIRTGEKMYRLDAGGYTSDLTTNVFGRYIEKPSTSSWSYAANSGADTFTATATRTSGSESGKNIIIDQDGNITGNYPYK